MELKEFFTGDFREFSLDDTRRSLPSMIDGLKESQRKIIYGLQSKGMNLNEIKVAQLAAVVSERTDYHHGEKSLESAIVGLAQDYVGLIILIYLTPLEHLETDFHQMPHLQDISLPNLHPILRNYIVKKMKVF